MLFGLLLVFVQISSTASETCIGPYCYTIDPSCVGVSVSFSYNGQTFINQQLDLSKPFCQPIYQDCMWCANATTQGQIVHYCYETKNCQGVTTQGGRCFDVDTNCNNAGKCVVGGLCQCNQGYYGSDCSILVKDNCMVTDIDKLCWRLLFPDCNTVDLELTSQVRGVLVRQNSSINEPIKFPCQAFPNLPDCQMCVVVNNLAIMGDTLIGTPTITLCNNRKYELGTIPLVKTSRLSYCPSYYPPTTETPTTYAGRSQNSDSAMGAGDTGKTILLVLACILGLLFLGGIGYYVIRKYFDVTDTFQQVEVYADDEDVAPLRKNED